ncbi:MAG: hypothetical protein ACT4OM_07010 [Actinomycetota bacterium]
MAQTTVVATDASLVEDAIALSKISQLSFWDALIVRAAAKGGCDTLWTEDLTDGQSLDGVLVGDPFKGREVS